MASILLPNTNTGADPRQDYLNLIETRTPSAWGQYWRHAKEYDADLEKDWKDDLDTLLIVASLFSSVLAGFTVWTLPMLKEDTSETARNVLFIISGQLAHSSNSSLPFIPAASTSDISQPETWATRVNACFAASLSLSIVAVLLAMLSKQWIREYTRSLDGVSDEQERAKRRHFRYLGLEKWKMAQFMSTIPLLIHLSLLVFFYALCDLLFNFHRTVAIVAASIFGIGATLYILLIVAAACFADCPYRSPMSNAAYTTLGPLWRPILALLLVPLLLLASLYAVVVATFCCHQYPHHRPVKKAWSWLLKALGSLIGELLERSGIKNRERTVVKADDSLARQCLDWLLTAPNFSPTPATFEAIVRTNLPSTANVISDKEGREMDVPWQPFLTDLSRNFYGRPSKRDAAQRNVVCRTLVQTLLWADPSEDAELTLPPELEQFRKWSMYAYEDEAGTELTNAQQRVAEQSGIWTEILCMRFDPKSFESFRAWLPFEHHFFAIPEDTTITVLNAHIKWAKLLSIEYRRQSIGHFEEVLMQFNPPLPPSSSLTTKLVAMNRSARVAPRILRLIIELVQTFVSLETTTQTQPRRSATQDLHIDPRHHRILSLSIGPMRLLLPHAPASGISGLLITMRNALKHAFDEMDSKLHTTVALSWLWNQHDSFKFHHRHQELKPSDLRTAHALLATFVRARWHGHDYEATLQSLWTKHSSVKEFNIWDHLEAVWNDEEEREANALILCKTVITAADSSWDGVVGSEGNRFRQQLLFQIQDRDGNVGLFHSWIFSAFDQLSDNEKRECVAFCSVPETRAALVERWDMLEDIEVVNTVPENGDITEVSPVPPDHKVMEGTLTIQLDNAASSVLTESPIEAPSVTGRISRNGGAWEAPDDHFQQFGEGDEEPQQDTNAVFAKEDDSSHLGHGPIQMQPQNETASELGGSSGR